MSTLSIWIVIVFCIGYFCIAIESLTKVNKSAVALLMFVATWTLFMLDPGSYVSGAVGQQVAQAVSEVIEHHLGSTSTTLFFLMGAMTIVELVDQNGGFNFVRDTLQTKSKKALLWRIAFMTFILSAILDNLTTSIVMIMILRKLVSDKKDRLIYAALVVIAANSGGAFSPIGDVTTIMLWNKGVITAAGVITEIFVPSLISMVIPAYILSLSLKGELTFTAQQAQTLAASDLTPSETAMPTCIKPIQWRNSSPSATSAKTVATLPPNALACKASTMRRPCWPPSSRTSSPSPPAASNTAPTIFSPPSRPLKRAATSFAKSLSATRSPKRK